MKMPDARRAPLKGPSLGVVLTVLVLWSAPGEVAEQGARLFQRECAGCHGPLAWGGNAGEYRRLAGLPASYLAQQLAGFRDRKRQNKPMLPIFKAGRLGADDIAAVAAHLAALPLTDNPPVTRQYPAYLMKQIRDFRTGERWHEYAEALFQEAELEELDALLAYMLELNHRPAVPVPTDPPAPAPD